MKNRICIIGLIFIGIVFQNCLSNKNSSVVYTEERVKPSEVAYKTVAILPNRLPINLQDPEYWRKYNWDIIANYFRRQGVNVIDYRTSVNMFNTSGLPIEDTKVSRDKYADLAQRIGADLLIIPYYSTIYKQSSGLWSNLHIYSSIGTLQVYYAYENEFIARVDFEGTASYKMSGPVISIFPMVPMVVGQFVSDSETMQGVSILGSGVMVLFMMRDLVNSTRTPEECWQIAFRDGINGGMARFRAAYPGSGTPTRPKQLSTEESPVSVDYNKFRREELEGMLEKAVGQEDFQLASILTEELKKRPASVQTSIKKEEKTIPQQNAIVKEREQIVAVAKVPKTKSGLLFTDERDKKQYDIAFINNQLWFAENLNYDAKNGSWCYDDQEDNCNKFGKLYNWETAKTVCPEGWRLPEKVDYEAIFSNIGDTPGTIYSGLLEGGNSEFYAEPGGWRYTSGNYRLLGENAYFWTISELDSEKAYYVYLHKNNRNAGIETQSKELAASVRCVKVDDAYLKRIEERLSAEKAERERISAEKAEHERIAAEKAEQERIAAEKAEQERIAAEKAEQERIAAEKAEQEQIIAVKDSQGFVSDESDIDAKNDVDKEFHSEKHEQKLSDGDFSGNDYLDKRDNQIYKVVEINSTSWMAENLNYDAGSGSWCYENSNENCARYGRMYSWDIAKDACPDGWQLPDKEDYESLIDYYGGGSSAYNKLVVDEEIAFFAKLSGWRHDNDVYRLIDRNGYYWTLTSERSGKSWHLLLRDDGSVVRMRSEYNEVGMSVRCIRK